MVLALFYLKSIYSNVVQGILCDIVGYGGGVSQASFLFLFSQVVLQIFLKKTTNKDAFSVFFYCYHHKNSKNCIKSYSLI